MVDYQCIPGSQAEGLGDRKFSTGQIILTDLPSELRGDAAEMSEMVSSFFVVLLLHRFTPLSNTRARIAAHLKSLQ